MINLRMKKASAFVNKDLVVALFSQTFSSRVTRCKKSRYNEES